MTFDVSRRSIRRLCQACLAAALLAPAAVSAQDEGGAEREAGARTGAGAQEDVDDVRIAGYLALGFGGNADLVEPPDADLGRLDPTVGFGFRAEFPLHRYFVLGGSFEMLTYDSDGDYDSVREELFDIDVLLRVRYPIELSSDVSIEPYANLPLGLTLAPVPGADDAVWPGWNLGVLAGLYVVLTSLPLAFFAEVGWRHHQIYNQDGAQDVRIVINDFAMQLGAAIRIE